jgi:hypothetical protein
MFVIKAVAYSSEATYGELLTVPSDVKTSPKKLDWEKYSRIFCLTASDKDKKFCNADIFGYNALSIRAI